MENDDGIVETVNDEMPFISGQTRSVQSSFLESFIYARELYFY